jgi:gamma-carbonic anhydrase
MSQPLAPKIGKNVFIAPTAYVGGDVHLSDNVSVMHHVTIRGDVARITVGARVNIQDGTVLHTRHGVPLEIARDVVIGHRAVVHCRRVGTRSLIGIGAIVLDNAEIGANCIIAAGSVIPPDSIIPDNSLVMGIPGLITRTTTEADLSMIDEVVARYVELGRAHEVGNYPNIATSKTNVPT